MNLLWQIFEIRMAQSFFCAYSVVGVRLEHFLLLVIKLLLGDLSRANQVLEQFMSNLELAIARINDFSIVGDLHGLANSSYSEFPLL